MVSKIATGTGVLTAKSREKIGGGRDLVSSLPDKPGDNH